MMDEKDYLEWIDTEIDVLTKAIDGVINSPNLNWEQEVELLKKYGGERKELIMMKFNHMNKFRGRYDVPGSHPLERLRNKLTPFMLLVQIADKVEDGRMREVYESTLSACRSEIEGINKYLSDCETFYELQNFRN